MAKRLLGLGRQCARVFPKHRKRPRLNLIKNKQIQKVVFRNWNASQSIARSIAAIRRMIKNSDTTVRYLLGANVLEWLFADPLFLQRLTKEKETAWGKAVVGCNTTQWTTQVGEGILCDILLLQGQFPRRVSAKKASNGKNLCPDWETETALYENKARTYTVTGTAGEKILGVPMKYCECKRLYGKPLYIVCMAFQEIEAEDTFMLFDPHSKELQDTLTDYDKRLSIRYVKATDMLLGLVNR